MKQFSKLLLSLVILISLSLVVGCSGSSSKAPDPDLTCSEGQALVNDECVDLSQDAIECEDSEEFVDGECVKKEEPVVCEDDQVLNEDGECVYVRFKSKGLLEMNHNASRGISGRKFEEKVWDKKIRIPIEEYKTLHSVEIEAVPHAEPLRPKCETGKIWFMTKCVDDYEINLLTEIPDPMLYKAVKKSLDQYNVNIEDDIIKFSEAIKVLGLVHDGYYDIPVTSLRGLKHFKGIKYFILDYNHIESGFEEICELKRLKRVSLVSSNVENVECLGSLKYLEAVDLSNNRFLINVNKLPDLKILSLYSSRIKSFKEISHLKNLEALQISREYSRMHNRAPIKDLEELRKFKKLRSLFINNGVNDVDLEIFESLPKLKRLNLEGNNLKNPDFSSLTGLEKLVLDKNYNMTKMNLSNLEFLEKMSCINCYKLNDVEGTEDLKSLKILELQVSWSINSSNFLKKLHNLEYLDLSANYISDVSFIKNMNRLYYVNLSSNIISNIKPLMKDNFSRGSYYSLERDGNVENGLYINVMGNPISQEDQKNLFDYLTSHYGEYLELHLYQFPEHL